MLRAHPVVASFSVLLGLATSACVGPAATGGAGGQSSATTSASTGTTIPGAPTFYEDVSPIVMKHCASCHVDGGIAPFKLVTFEDVKERAGQMKAATAARTMPPYPADASGECNTFKDARWLTDEEIAKIGAWADGGVQEGDPAHALPMPTPPAGLESPTLTLAGSEPYMPDANLADDYHCIVIDPKLAEDQFITSYELVPDQPKEVHHAILYALETDKDEAVVDGLNKGGHGYPCFGGPGANGHPVALWAPGGGVTTYPSGTGLKLTAGRKVVLQIHYNLENGATPDRTELKLLLAKGIPNAATLIAVSDPKSLYLAPRQTDATGTATFTVPKAAKKGIDIWGDAPHMHTRGTKVDVKTADTCLIDVPRWNFHWQMFYQYEDKPIHLAPGEKVTLTCHYNTMAETAPVKWGEGTADEMCINYLFATLTP